MLFKMRIVEKCGFPIFRMIGYDVEKGDTLRMQNYAKTMANNFRWAFECHEKASDAYRRKLPNANGMQFGEFVGRMFSLGRHVRKTELTDFKDKVSSLLDKLDKNDPTVKELKNLCRVDTDPDIAYKHMFCNGS